MTHQVGLKAPVSRIPEELQQALLRAERPLQYPQVQVQPPALPA